jgi:DNA-binding NtrC family response regulator
MNHLPIQLSQGEGEEVALSTTLNSLRSLARTLTIEVTALENILTPDIEIGVDFYERVRQFEINLIKLALARTGGHQRRAARLLRLNRSTLNAKIKLYKLNSQLIIDESMEEMHVQ